MYRGAALLLAASALSGCQVSVGSGGLDYDKLEGAITTELNNNYTAISRQVAGVDCPRQALKQPLIFDGRNLYDPEFMRESGFIYYAIGRGETP